LKSIDTKFALMLSLIDGIGPVKYKKIIQHFQDCNGFIANTDSEIFSECGLSDKQISVIKNFSSWKKIDQILETAVRMNITIICYGQDDYPEYLSNIYAPPIALYIKGNIQNISKPAVAIVGSRKPTAYGRSMARKISSGLASRGLAVVSGLAWGIDAEAHKTAIEVGGITGAVFGSGLNIIYPGDHRYLAEQILKDGYWISEFPFGTKPERHNFPRRNRIISGLSQAVLVVEAAEKSGALVTASIALEQDRDVFAVPGQADSPASGGTIKLIKQGASVATSAEDILESLGWDVSQKLNQFEQRTPAAYIKLDPDEQKICDIIGNGPAHFDELVRNLNFTSSKVSTILLKLELTGLVARQPGNYVARI